MGKMSAKTVIESFKFTPFKNVDPRKGDPIEAEDENNNDWVVVDPIDLKSKVVSFNPFLPLFKIALLNIFGFSCRITELTSSKENLFKHVLESGLQITEYLLYHSDEDFISDPDNKIHSKINLQKIPKDSKEIDVSQSDLVIVNSDSSIDFKFCLNLLQSVDTKAMIFLMMASEDLKQMTENGNNGYKNGNSKMTPDEKIAYFLTNVGFSILASHVSSDGSMAVLFRKPVMTPFIRLNTTPSDFEWIQKLQNVEKAEDKRIFLTSNRLETGLIGLVKCLRLENDYFRTNLRVVVGLSDNKKIPKEIIEKDLLYTIIRPEGEGCFVHEVIEDLSVKKEVTHAHLDVAQTGDLSSLTFYETQEKINDKKEDSIEVDVAFSALNFKDVMVASGRIPTSAYPEGSSTEGVLGMEFSGTTKDGRKVMGMTSNNGIATKIHLDNPLYWDVPANMSLRDAATIPVAYTTVYYALFGRGNIQPKESVLIHSGAGAVGQAAIHVCLSLDCEVFVTIGSEEKKQFLLKEFPKLKPSNFFSSRNTDFENEILKLTNGLGVDIILNSLAEEKLRSSIYCLSEFGRFLGDR